MIIKKGMPITGGKTETSSKKPFVPNAKDTSSDEQTMIAEAPSPVKNRNQTGEMPAPSGASGGVSTLEPKIQSGLKHSSPGVKALPSNGPIGQKKPINQSAQIGGRMSWPPPKRKAGVNGQGFPSKRGAAFYGEN